MGLNTRPSGPAAGVEAVPRAPSELGKEVFRSLAPLEEMSKHRAKLGDAATDSLLGAAREVRRRLERSDAYVCIVGEQKSGKSTFLNAILGQELLGTAVRECTGTVTFIRIADRLHYRAQFVGGEVEDFNSFHTDRHDEFAAQIRQSEQSFRQCQSDAQLLPKEISRLQEVLTQMPIELAQLRQRHQNAAEISEVAAKAYANQRQATLAFEKSVRDAESAVPFCYRTTGKWWWAAHRLGRVVCKPFADPNWASHFERVQRLEDDLQLTQKLESKSQLAAQATQDAQAEVERHNSAITTTQQKLVDTKHRLASLPGLAREWKARWKKSHLEWNDHKAERLQLMTERLRDLTDMNGRGANVEQLHVTCTSRRLPPDVVLIDTPGVNTAVVANQERAWRVIYEHADACIVLSDIGQAVSESTREFVRKVRSVVPHIVLVLTKLDAAAAGASIDGDAGAESQVAEAVQEGRRRFAEEVGRSEVEVLSFAVAARPALRNASAADVQRFDEVLRRLFTVIATERQIAIAARCAIAIQTVNRDTRDTADQAEQAYADRIAALSAQQIENPRQFVNSQIDVLSKECRTVANAISTQMKSELLREIERFQAQALSGMETANNEQELAAAVNVLADSASAQISQIQQRCRSRIDSQHGDEIRRLVLQVRHPLIQRYQLASQVSRTAPREIPLRVFSVGDQVRLESTAAELETKVQKFIRSRKNLMVGAGRAGEMAVRNHSLAGLVAVAAGAALVATLSGGFKKLKQECLDAIESDLADMKKAALSERQIGSDAMLTALCAGLAAVANQDVAEFRAWISRIIQTEREELRREQEQLTHFRGLRDRLASHDRQLGALMERATAHCLGLTRMLTPDGKS